MRKRLKPTIRKPHILEAALAVARARTLPQTTLTAVAEEAGISHALVTHYFSTVKKLRRAVMRLAVEQEDLQVIAFGLVTNNKQALKAAPELQQRARGWRI